MGYSWATRAGRPKRSGERGGRHKSCQNPGQHTPLELEPGAYPITGEGGRHHRPAEASPYTEQGGGAGRGGDTLHPGQTRPARSTTAGHARTRTGRHHRPAPPASTRPRSTSSNRRPAAHRTCPQEPPGAPETGAPAPRHPPESRPLRTIIEGDDAERKPLTSSNRCPYTRPRGQQRRRRCSLDTKGEHTCRTSRSSPGWCR